MKYVGTIYRPIKNPQDGGREGQPEVVCPDWPCSRATPSGRQMEVAQQMVPLVTHILEGWYPGKTVSHKDYVEIEGRRFNVEFVDDSKNHGQKLRLLCIEEGQ